MEDRSSKELSPRKRKIFILLTIGVSASIMLMCAEILVRALRPYNTPDTIRHYSLQYIPSIFARHMLEPAGRLVEVDSMKGWGDKRETEKARMAFFINEIGYRGRSFAVRKPPGVYRVVILGGSAVFDQNANEGNDWPHLVERLLKNMGYSSVEVINAGIPGHASFDSVGRLYSQIWIFEPDYIILYNTWNDIKYFRTLTPEKPLISHFKPYDDKGDPLKNYQGLLDGFFSMSQLYVKIRNRYFVWKLHIGRQGAIPAGDYQSAYGAYGIKQFKLNIELIVDASRNIGAVPLLVTQATLVSSKNTAEDRKLIMYQYQRLNHDALVKAFHESEEVIRLVAQEKGVDFLDLAEMLNGQRALFTDEVHTTRKGSEEIARLVAKFLGKQLNQGL